MRETTKNLSSTEERALIKRARQGDVGARNLLMEVYYDAAMASCRRHGRAKGLDQDDADSEVFFAIAEAIEGYDLRKRTPFGAYVDQRARGAVTWADREQRRQDLRKVTVHWQKCFGGPGPPGKGMERVAREKAPRKAEVRNRLIGQYIFRHCGDRFRQWLRACPRKHDRFIARRLWWDAVPTSQAEIARKLKISRSAVCQRRKLLISEILGVDEDFIVNQELTQIPLNKFPPFAIIDMDFDW